MPVLGLRFTTCSPFPIFIIPTLLTALSQLTAFPFFRMHRIALGDRESPSNHLVQRRWSFGQRRTEMA
eukprot:6191709-Pleurochrysis_carterae.AAC.4